MMIITTTVLLTTLAYLVWQAPTPYKESTIIIVQHNTPITVSVEPYESVSVLVDLSTILKD